MPDLPYTVPPIADGAELLAAVRLSLRTSMQLALDGNDGTLSPSDALGLIYNNAADTLAVVKASKELI